MEMPHTKHLFVFVFVILWLTPTKTSQKKKTPGAISNQATGSRSSAPHGPPHDLARRVHGAAPGQNMLFTFTYSGRLQKCSNKLCLKTKTEKKLKQKTHGCGRKMGSLKLGGRPEANTGSQSCHRIVEAKRGFEKRLAVLLFCEFPLVGWL